LCAVISLLVNIDAALAALPPDLQTKITSFPDYFLIELEIVESGIFLLPFLTIT
jgi:hypothetical protein